MSFLLSPSFLVLNLLSLVVLIVELSGLARAVRRHNHSPIGLLCDRDARLPTHAMRVAVAVYVILTVAYLFLPSVLHNLIP
jgi:hypothetical protein